MLKYILSATMLLSLLSYQADAQSKRRKRSIPKKQISTKPAPVVESAKSEFNNAALLCSANQSMPAWFLASKINFAFPAGFQAPAQYKLTTINFTSFLNHLRSIPFKESDKQITLPLYLGDVMICNEYDIVRNETMDSALQAKYPNIMSFAASQKTNPLNDARIESDGESIRIMVRHEGETYFIQSFKHNNRYYFAHYSKNDPNFIKQEFETRR